MENNPVVYMHEFWRGYDEDGSMEYVLSTLSYLSYEWRHNPEEASTVIDYSFNPDNFNVPYLRVEDIDWEEKGYADGYNDILPEYPENPEYMKGYSEGSDNC
jgi:hypothetical protein